MEGFSSSTLLPWRVLGFNIWWEAVSLKHSVWYNLHSVLKVSHTSSLVRSLFLWKTAVKTFGKAEVTICAWLEILSSELLLFLFSGLVNVESFMKEFNESMLFKYSAVFWYAWRQSIQRFFLLSSISKADGKKSLFAFVPISICLMPLTTFLSAVYINSNSVADTVHFSPSFFSVRNCDLTNFAAIFHNNVSISPYKISLLYTVTM